MAENGILDLRNWDLNKNGNIKLNGQWEFYWNNLYTPAHFNSKSTIKAEYIKVPKLWDKNAPDKKIYPINGFATYRLKILLDKSDQLLNLYTKTAVYSSSNIFINGLSIGGNGKVAKNKSNELASYNILSEPFLHDTDEIEIVIQVSNFEKNRPGGFIFELEMGEYHQIARLEKENLIISLLIIGGIFIVMIYHLVLFIRRPSNKSTLYFALFNLFFLLYFSSLYGMQYFIPNFQIIRNARILGWFMAVPVFMVLIKSIFPNEINNRLPRIAILIGILSYLSFLFEIEYTLDFYKGVTIVSELYIIFIAILALIRKKENAQIFLFSITFVAITGINDSLLHFGMIKSVNLTQFGIFFFILLQSYILSVRFSSAHKKNERLSTELAFINKNLESLVIERTKKIEEQNKQLEKLNITKDRFFSIIAHDLRGPVGNISASLDLITENFNSLDENTKLDLLNNLKLSSNKTYHLLENLLIWARLQGDSIQFEPNNIILYELVAESVDLLKIDAEKKQIEINTEIPEKLEIYADNYMMDMIVRNLLGNAIKFTDTNGKIDIRAKHLNDKVEISVSDTGIGIKKENLNKLFHIEHNLSAVGTNGERGSGLGLVLCKEFIEQHNGKISVYSDLGVGSSFQFFLPSQKS